MTFSDKMNFIDAFKEKVNEAFDAWFQSAMTADGLKHMTASDLERVKILVETKDMFNDLVKGLAWDVCRAKDIAEENNRILKNIERRLDSTKK